MIVPVYLTIWLFSAVVVCPALFCDLSRLESGNPPVLPSRYGLCLGHRAFGGGALMAQTKMVLMTNLKKKIRLTSRDSSHSTGRPSHLASGQRSSMGRPCAIHPTRLKNGGH